MFIMIPKLYFGDNFKYKGVLNIILKVLPNETNYYHIPLMNLLSRIEGLIERRKCLMNLFLQKRGLLEKEVRGHNIITLSCIFSI
jgi:hypothetical protein